MATLPVLLDLIDDFDRDCYSPYYNFGFGIQPHRLQCRRSQRPLSILDYALPLRLIGSQQLARRGGGGADNNNANLSSIGKDGFQVCMDVEQFKPNELNVKVVDDNIIVVEGKHEDREDDHGFISRHFVRRYALPKGYEADKVQSSLSSDGVLTITVPKPQAIEDKTKERVIQIQQTGPAHLNIKENGEEVAEGAEGGKTAEEPAKQ